MEAHAIVSKIAPPAGGVVKKHLNDAHRSITGVSTNIFKKTGEILKTIITLAHNNKSNSRLTPYPNQIKEMRILKEPLVLQQILAEPSTLNVS